MLPQFTILYFHQAEMFTRAQIEITPAPTDTAGPTPHEIAAAIAAAGRRKVRKFLSVPIVVKTIKSDVEETAFSKHVTQALYEQTWRRKVDFVFRLMDLDGSGYIEHAELKALFMKNIEVGGSREVAAEYLIERILDEIDDDSDDRLSYEEWVGGGHW